jgi:hypothetical protein
MIVISYYYHININMTTSSEMRRIVMFIYNVSYNHITTFLAEVMILQHDENVRNMVLESYYNHIDVILNMVY